MRESGASLSSARGAIVTVPSLFVIQGRNRGARYDLSGHDGPVSIGRESGNVVQLDDNEVSRRHAEIRVSEGVPSIVDLGSSNGTFVNGRRVERTRLVPGDQVLVGRTVMTYTAAVPGAAPPEEAIDVSAVADDGSPAALLARYGRDTLEEVFLDVARGRAGAA